MSGNHARENYYQPGALIYREEDTVYTGAGNFTHAATGAWSGFSRALSLGGYTPTVDCVALVTAQVTSSHSNADELYSFRIRETTGGSSLAIGFVSGIPADDGQTWNAIKYEELTAGTTYTFAVQFYQDNATMTIAELAAYTFIQMMVYRKP